MINMIRQVMNTGLLSSLRTVRYAPAVGQVVAAREYAKDGKDKQTPVLNHADVPIVDYDDPDYIPLPEYPQRPNEPLEIRKQRLIYQSRKRGMLENDLLLSTFASKYLKQMDATLTAQYDQLINGVTNDWDIYYWATKVKPTPPEHDNEVMKMLKEHVANSECEQRLRQPNL